MNRSPFRRYSLAHFHGERARQRAFGALVRGRVWVSSQRHPPRRFHTDPDQGPTGRAASGHEQPCAFTRVTGPRRAVGGAGFQALHLRVVVRFGRSATGWVATVDSPDQHVRGLPVDVVPPSRATELDLELTNIAARYAARMAGEEMKEPDTKRKRLAAGSRKADRRRYQAQIRTPLPYQEARDERPHPGHRGHARLYADEAARKGRRAVVLAVGLETRRMSGGRFDHRAQIRSWFSRTRSPAWRRGGFSLRQARCGEVDGELRARRRRSISPTMCGRGGRSSRAAGHGPGARRRGRALGGVHRRRHRRRQSQDVAFVVLLAGAAVPGDENPSSAAGLVRARCRDER